MGLKIRKNRDWSLIIAIWLLVAVLIVAAFFAYSGWMQEGMTMRTVKAVCDYAHGIDDGGSEETCGLAQDTAGMEYLCSSEGYDTSCWVEVK